MLFALRYHDPPSTRLATYYISREQDCALNAKPGTRKFHCHHLFYLEYGLVKRVIELYAEMKTPKEVGAIVGITGDTVRTILKENGIHIRKSWEYPKK